MRAPQCGVSRFCAIPLGTEDPNSCNCMCARGHYNFEYIKTSFWDFGSFLLAVELITCKLNLLERISHASLDWSGVDINSCMIHLVMIEVISPVYNSLEYLNLGF